MRCSCQACGTYMVQRERGLESGCVCPQCFNVCTACMGTGRQPLGPEGLAALVLSRQSTDALPSEGDLQKEDVLSYRDLYED